MERPMYYDEVAIMDDEMDDAADGGSGRTGDIGGGNGCSGGQTVSGDIAAKRDDDSDLRQLRPQEQQQQQQQRQQEQQQLQRSPLPKQRSHSDGGTGGGSTPRLSPSPYIFEASSNRRTSKDDSLVRDRAVGPSGRGADGGGTGNGTVGTPVTPRRPPIATGMADFLLRGGGGLTLQMPRQDATGISSSSNSNHSSPATSRAPGFPGLDSAISTPSSSYFKQQVPVPVPVSPKLDSSIYGSPPTTNLLPRRSRGLDFSRAATSLHHSTLAEQSSPDSSPTIGSGSMRGFGGGAGFSNVPGMRRSGDFSAVGDSGMEGSGGTGSLWSMVGGQERTHMPSGLGSGIVLGGGGSSAVAVSDSDSSSDEDDLMDDYGDETFVSTPQAAGRTVPGGGLASGATQIGGSPVINSSLLSFQQRQRRIKVPKKRLRAPGPLGLGFSAASVAGSSSAAMLSRSPPNHAGKGDIGLGMGLGLGMPHSRRESISWAANQLHISGNESDGGVEHGQALEGVDGLLATPSKDGQKGVIRRVVTRRGNLLPKTKGFARIRAALAEESQPIDAEFRREAEVVRQVRERDMGLEPRMAALQSPILGPLTTDSTQESSSHDDVLADDDMMTDAASGEAPGTFKQDALRRARGRPFWANFSDSSSSTPPSSFPPPQGQSQQQSMFPRHSSSGLSDMSLDDSPALTATTRTNSISTVGGQLSQAQSAQQQASQRQQQGGPQTPVPAGFSQQQPFPPHFTPPTAAEITRRINAKRRRGADTDDLLFTDPQGAGFKRRAVSPSMGAGGSGASSANRDSGQNGDRDRPSSRSSVANSPVLQSPMARDNGNGGASVPPWSSGSRSGSGAGTPLSGLGTAAGGAADAGPVTRGRRSLSVGGEGLGIVGLGVGHQDSSQQMQQARGGASGVTSRPPSEAGSVGGQAAASSQGRASGGGATAPVSAASGGNLKGRVGFMGMIETNDGLMRMSIE